MAFFQTNSLWVNQLADGVAALVLDTPGGPTNLITPDVLTDLEAALDRIEQEARFGLRIVRSAKPASFCHGLDPAALDALPSPADFAALAERGQRLCARLAGL